MGVTGAAVATSIGRGIGVAYQLYLLFGGKSRIRISLKGARIVWDLMRRFLKISAPTVFQTFISTASFVAMFAIVNSFGEAVAAGYTVAIRIIVFALLPAWGMGNAAATLVGQYLGAGAPARAERVGRQLRQHGVPGRGRHPYVHICRVPHGRVRPGRRSNSRRQGVYTDYTYVLFAFGMVTNLAFNGAGDTATPTWINFISYWLIQLPLAYVLAYPLGWGATGIFTAIAIAQAALAIIGIGIFRIGRWKTKTV